MPNLTETAYTSTFNPHFTDSSNPLPPHPLTNRRISRAARSLLIKDLLHEQNFRPPNPPILGGIRIKSPRIGGCEGAFHDSCRRSKDEKEQLLPLSRRTFGVAQSPDDFVVGAYGIRPLSLLAGTIRGRKPCAPTGILLWNQFKKSSSQN